mmetsp:Transcript_108292/g.171181  ORF Transcript_108292/g.171181 Transcript_108292/m.171181 type:complete len:453 (+) Transcript_108292:1-1359(+)
MNWLDSADLSEQVLEDTVALCKSEFTLQDGDSQHESGHERQVVPSQSTDLVSRRLEQGMCCRNPWRLGTAKDVKMITMGTSQEEMEWDERQKLTGAAARLVSYSRDESPQTDFTLRGGEGRRIVVAAVRDDGVAFTCGVTAGDLLVSIDGKKDFVGKSADDVHASLRGPCVLVFLGFVGKLAAEVRLGHKGRNKIGISSHQEFVCRPEHRVEVTDEIVFQATGPLLLATPTWAVTPSSQLASQPKSQPSSIVERYIDSIAEGNEDLLSDVLSGSDDKPLESKDAISPSLAVDIRPSADGKQPTAVYELRGSEARLLVRGALGQTPRNQESQVAWAIRQADSKIQDVSQKRTLSRPGQQPVYEPADSSFRMGPSIATAVDAKRFPSDKDDYHPILTKPVQVFGDIGQDGVDILGPSTTVPLAYDNLQAKPWNTIGASPVVSPASSTLSSPREA